MKPHQIWLCFIILTLLAILSVIEPVKDGPFAPDASTNTSWKEVYDDNGHRVLRSK
jgi:hypothetical protein